MSLFFGLQAFPGGICRLAHFFFLLTCRCLSFFLARGEGLLCPKFASYPPPLWLVYRVWRHDGHFSLHAISRTFTGSLHILYTSALFPISSLSSGPPFSSHLTDWLKVERGVPSLSLCTRVVMRHSPLSRSQSSSVLVLLPSILINTL